mmetsp:Transcript_50013/g.143998  ORF Transcript_50013/g.143998 Transcript_50013/m.143998 type:complete len:144 (-) Transcript_50013:199-630(-)|eukprot:CAMPEP_0176098688 /NCGR_PEP_ID=MMETSP0120_2-20121206/49483_1 /TAXON_ID=160619 /ORGANISM="Kryptoperidinium foliaceum, Strain CCMP 1326" /LENGTH=143 /DNA_ID=CAMNT_0017432699 /DNA_START=46 /DNA_END=477 /DNA_ORIENTATION=+
MNLSALVSFLLVGSTAAFSGPFVPKASFCAPKSTSSLKMVDANVIQGAGIAVAGLAVGIGMVAFTEQQGERAKERGGGLSETMSTQLSGMLLEDVEVSSVSDVGSLTSQLEEALKKSGGTTDKELEMTEEDRKRLAEEADDGW